MKPATDIRWQQRYSHFSSALALLEEGIQRGAASLNPLEKEGLVHPFEFTLELAWKTLKDFLEESGMTLTVATPREVIRTAHTAGLVADGNVWLLMLDHRNLLAHTYDAARFEEALVAITRDYLGALRSLHTFFHSQCNRP